jgi:chromate transport protein ChrA
MPIGAQPPGRRGTVGEPYSALNLRLVLAAFGFLVCTGLALLLWRWGWTVPAWILAACAVVAVIDMVVVQLRRRARRRAEGGRRHSLFE